MVGGLAPMVQLDSIDRQGMNLRVQMLVDNLNDRPILLTGLRLEAGLDGADLFIGQWPLDILVAARGRERVTLETTAALAGLEALDGLAELEAGAIRYRLNGELFWDRKSSQAIDQGGFLHPVPGQPDRFR